MPSDPMTDADLDRIERHAEYGHFEGQDYDAVETLVAEVRRLRAEVAGADENVASWQGIAADLREERDHYRDGISAMYDDEHLWRDQGEERLRTNVRMTLAGALELDLIGDDRE